MADDKKFFDVTKPGRSAPDATARPVIVANRSMVKDPTLKHIDDDDDKTGESLKIVKTEAKIVTPPKGLTTQMAETTDKEPQTDNSEPAEVPVVDKQVEQNRLEQEKQSDQQKADQARAQQAEEMIKSGKYVVPVGHIKRNRRIRRTLLALLLAISLLIVVGDLLIDAGVIKTNVKPLIDLIKN